MSEELSFDNLGIKENLLRGVYSYGYEKPSKIQFKARGIAIISATADDKISEGLTAYIMDNPEVAGALFDDDMEIEGLATIDIQTMRKVDTLAAQIDVQSQELQEVVNQLNQMIQGEKPAGDEE